MNKDHIQDSYPVVAEPPESRTFSIQYLLVVTASFAVAIGLAVETNFPIPIRLIGFATCCFWLSKGIFVTGMHLPTPMREIIFVIGLPLYLCTIMGIIASIFAIVLLVSMAF